MRGDFKMTTLAYKKSPKTSKRTTFQDELQAAVSARASKTSTNQYSYYDDFEEDEDDFLNELLKSRKKKTDAFKASKKKAQFNTFELSDDEGRENRTKKVSFLKTQRNFSPQNNTTVSESQDNEVADSSVVISNDLNDSFSSKHSTKASDEITRGENGFLDSTDAQKPEQNSGENMSSSLPDLTLSQTLESGTAESSAVNSSVKLSASDVTHMESTERLPPKPKPRQRTLGLISQTIQKPAEESVAQDVSRPHTSSTSIHLSSDTSSNVAVASSSPHCLAGHYTESQSLSRSTSSHSESSQLIKLSTVDSGSRDDFVPYHSKEQKTNHSTSHEEGNECSDPISPVPKTSLNDVKQFPPGINKGILNTTTQSSLCKTTWSVCSRKVESKYLGTLKILDQKVSPQETEQLAADALRATVYQEWLKKKNEKSKEKMQLKQKEEMQKEEKKKEQEAKERDAVASYEAWKKRKADYFKAKAKEKQEMIRKEKEATLEKVEKRQSAEQWKSEHDDLLKEKYRKQLETENKLKMKKQEEDEERKNNCKSAVSNWCEIKKNVLQEQHTSQQKTLWNKKKEEQYMKEERDQMALEMYESWLARKDLEEKRQRKERVVQAILSDSPPPPWSPPNKTVPFRKY
ncbi:microtubule-associated protein 9-like isoform X2 [Gouania willdenowi]|uniref:microtubule-associated protein 9-like isoform X2 n=1 Tax=Gouania willdenowi TaxID=441366 RepID=UPI0010551C7E|nr:microtubule-associated protein 9-like isoform X2 [Gouania willdenowi]